MSKREREGERERVCVCVDENVEITFFASIYVLCVQE